MFSQVVKHHGLKTINEVYKIIDKKNNTLAPTLQPWMVNMRRSFLYENLENFLVRCHENGMISYFQKQEFEEIREKLEDPDPQILTTQILSAGFLVWLGSVVVCIIVFLFEHVVFWLR